MSSGYRTSVRDTDAESREDWPGAGMPQPRSCRVGCGVRDALSNSVRKSTVAACLGCIAGCAYRGNRSRRGALRIGGINPSLHQKGRRPRCPFREKFLTGAPPTPCSAVGSPPGPSRAESRMSIRSMSTSERESCALGPTGKSVVTHRIPIVIATAQSCPVLEKK